MKAFLPAVLFVFIVSCAENKSSLSQSEKNGIVQEVSTALSDYYADIKKEGLAAEFKYLDSSADFFWVPPGFKTFISFDSVAAILRKNAPLYRSIENSWDHLHVIAVSGMLATYTGKLHSKITDTSGKLYEMDLIESGTVIKRGNKWKLLCGQTTTISQ